MTFDDMDVSDIFEDLEAIYVVNRYIITNTALGQSKVATPHNISAYIHPDDYKAVIYNGQGDRLEDRVKIFSKIATDIINDDEITYQGKAYRVMKDNEKIVGSYKKLIAELIK